MWVRPVVAEVFSSVGIWLDRALCQIIEVQGGVVKDHVQYTCLVIHNFRVHIHERQ